MASLYKLAANSVGLSQCAILLAFYVAYGLSAPRRLEHHFRTAAVASRRGDDIHFDEI